MKKKLAIANGTYTNAQGETKTRWVNIGLINTNAQGKEYMLLDPTINLAAFTREEGRDMVMIGMFEENNQQQQNQGQQQGYNQNPPIEYQNSQGQGYNPNQGQQRNYR